MYNDRNNVTRQRGCIALLAYIIILLTVAMIICSCRSQKRVASIARHSTITYCDTTKTATEITVRKTVTHDTTKTISAHQCSSVIEFVAAGGNVSVDSSGVITLRGVKSINNRRQASMTQQRAAGSQEEDSVTHHEQSNAIEAAHITRQKLVEEKLPARKWYETAFARLGQGVCIATLLWLLFLYLRRKF